jgi:acyl-CoA synthetase (AMP-forming)/AMP-acid ligase II
VIAREFDPTKVLDFFEQSGITKLFMVPAAMQFVVRQPRARQVDFSKLKYMLYGASPIPAALLKECIEVFGCGFVQMYGMTETTGTIVALPPEDHVEGLNRMRSAGKALPGVELAILDADGKRRQGGGGDEGGQDRDAVRHHQFHPRAYCRFQDAEVGRFHRSPAAQCVREDPAQASARSLLGGERPAGELDRHCEERKRRSNPAFGPLTEAGLLRFARNDGKGNAKPGRDGLGEPLNASPPPYSRTKTLLLSASGFPRCLR